uniref:Uncharacterized protein n=1 Tax=Theropithecus gelada TaxID=9565 RepID=A0A8D2FVR5_THEGE
MMAEVQTRFRELSACSQAECTSCRDKSFCMRLLMLHLHAKPESKLWFVSGRSDSIKLI